MTYTCIKTYENGPIGFIQLHRPNAMNALSENLFKDLNHALKVYTDDHKIHVVVLHGSENVFAAGADIKEMAQKTFSQVYRENFITATWEEISRCRKPIIAAVSGYALGGGCEIAMMADIIYAAENVAFGQPEITIGTIPAAGGTQRLTRYIGKSKTMEMCLTGNRIGAEEALSLGLVAQIFQTHSLLEEVTKIAHKIASMSLPAAMMIKEAVNTAYETTLQEGLKFERRLFHSTFALDDQKEGMKAFVEKRKPLFKHQ